jgi:hypothetical protein
MEEPGGWLWAVIGLGVILLGAVLMWNVIVWRSRRLSGAEKREQAEVTRENYRKGG